MTRPLPSAPQVELQIIGIVADSNAADVLERVLARAGTADRFTVTTDLAEGLSTAVAAAADLVFLDVTIGGGRASRACTTSGR
jgi:predicted O-methyltransferase YrrM